MTKAKLEAHLRMLSTLPVRTVVAQAPIYVNGNAKVGGRRKADTEVLHQQIVALHKKGKSRKEIADELGVSAPTVGKHLNGKIKCTRQSKSRR